MEELAFKDLGSPNVATLTTFGAVLGIHRDEMGGMKAGLVEQVRVAMLDYKLGGKGKGDKGDKGELRGWHLPTFAF